MESYDYLGLGMVVRRAHSQPGVDLTFIKQSGESNGDAGDQYTGLDRFGRVVDQRWIKTSGPTTTDRFQYGYDRNSNRLWRDNLVNTAFGELYAYDNLNQLSSFDRGTLNGTKTGLTGSASRAQDWDYDALGNWDSLTTDGGSPQTRSANAQNEITSISGATTPTYDANGNMTTDETGRQFVYDAWNRLVIVKNSGGTTLKTYSYDGLNRRVTETASGTTTDLFYSDQWQVLEEKVGSNTTKRYVWSPVYVDAMILRDRDTDANGTLDERLWVQQDANWNVTALLDGSGNVVERYGYDPFGVRTVYDASYNVRAGGSNYGFNHGFQGMWYDAIAGLNEADWRWYSPTLGRWVSLDPIRFAAGDSNFYRFLNNGPTNTTDPTGLQPPITCEAIANEAYALARLRGLSPADARDIANYADERSVNLNQASRSRVFYYLRDLQEAEREAIRRRAEMAARARALANVRLATGVFLFGGMVLLAEGAPRPPDGPVVPTSGGSGKGGNEEITIPPGSILIKKTNTAKGTLETWKFPPPDGRIVEIQR